MDPNATLQEIRSLVEHIQLGHADGESDAESLAEKVSALDEWLSRGGFLPKDWQR